MHLASGVELLGQRFALTGICVDHVMHNYDHFSCQKPPKWLEIQEKMPSVVNLFRE